MFEDQDDVHFFYDDTVPLQDGPRDWTLPSVSIITFLPYQNTLVSLVVVFKIRSSSFLYRSPIREKNLLFAKASIFGYESG